MDGYLIGRKGLIIALFILFMISLTGCLGSTATDGETGAIEADYANPNALISPTWLNDHLSDPNVRILEIGSSKASYEDHIPGASFVNWKNDIADPNSEVDNMVAPSEQIEGLLSGLGIGRDQTIVVYDTSGNVLAGRMYWVLKYYGHGDVRFLNGGKKLWRGKGLELTKEVPTPEGSDYTIDEMNPEYRVTWDYVKDNLDNPDVVILDVRSAAEYTGERALAKRGGHIPGAVNVNWKQTLKDDGTLKGAESLRKLYEEAGVNGAKEVIVYCHSGVLSAYTWMVLHEFVGYENVKLYDGSWVEWGNREGLPIATGSNPR